MRKFAPWLFFFPIILGTVYLFFYFFGSKILPESKIYQYANATLERQLGLNFKYHGFYVHFPKAIVFRDIEIFQKKQKILSAEELDLQLDYEFDKTRPIHSSIVLSKIDLMDFKHIGEIVDQLKSNQKKAVKTNTEQTFILSQAESWLETPDIHIRQASLLFQGIPLIAEGSIRSFNRFRARLNTPYGALLLSGAMKEKRALLSADLNMALEDGALNINMNTEIDFSEKMTKLKHQRMSLSFAQSKYLKYPFEIIFKGHSQLFKNILSGTLRFLPPKEQEGSTVLTGETDFYLPLKEANKWELRNAALTLSNWHSPGLEAGLFKIVGFISKKNHRLNAEASQLALTFPFFAKPLFFNELTGSWSNFSADIPLSEGSFEDHRYFLKLTSKDIRTLVELEIIGDFFQLDWFKASSKKKRSAPSLSPNLRLKVDVDSLAIGKINASTASAKVFASPHKIVLEELNAKMVGTDVLLNGTYVPKTKKFLGHYQCPQIKADTIGQILGEKVKLEGTFAMKGDIHYAYGEPTRVSAMLTNATKTIVLDKTSLQENIWKLPFISSKKSYQDIMINFESKILSTLEKDRIQYTIETLKADLGEFQVHMSGMIEKAKDIQTYLVDADIDLYFSDYFKNNYINATQGVKLLTSTSTAFKHFEKPRLWDGPSHLIKIKVGQEKGKNTYKPVKD